MNTTKARRGEREPRETLTPEAPDSERQLLMHGTGEVENAL